MSKKVVLVVASAGYQPVEYGETRMELEAKGIKVIVASNMAGTARTIPSDNHFKVCDDPLCTKIAHEHPEYATVDVDCVLHDLDPAQYDGIFLIGGPGAMEFLDNSVVYKIMQEVAYLGKPFGAICVSPRILAHAGLLKGKRATGWDGDHKLATFFQQHQVTYVKELVVTDGNIITASGPRAARLFGQAIVAALSCS